MLCSTKGASMYENGSTTSHALNWKIVYVYKFINFPNYVLESKMALHIQDNLLK